MTPKASLSPRGRWWRHGRHLAGGALVLAGLAMGHARAETGPPGPAIAARACSALSTRVDAEPGGGPVFLRSYDGPAGSGPPDDPALATAAFTYDNALAAVALIACGKVPQAARLGEALRIAAIADRSGERGRIRNAYRAGRQETPPPPNGWWDGGRGRWLEDTYQVGTSTGNAAWAGLALLSVAEATGNQAFDTAAEAIGERLVRTASDDRGPGGFTGGVHGEGPGARVLGWKSTEHHADLEALFGWLARRTGETRWADQARRARTFLASQWDPSDGHFVTGTLDDGITPNHGTSGLDAQLWPLLLLGAEDRWSRALAYAERAHGVAGGFSFNRDRSGFWTEGTAQAALAHAVTGQPARARALMAEVGRMTAPGGYLWAIKGDRMSTGLALGPDSTTDDFYYFRLPHLGATAWAALAGSGWNPFQGRMTGLARPPGR